jgi:predicted ribonuclease YlaK
MAFFGVSSRNETQKAAMQALCNSKPFTFITGPAGGGKTLIAQAVGLEHTLEERKYRKLVYTRLQSQMGKDIGALPGSIDEKTYPFMRPFLDNLEVMSTHAKQILAYEMSGGEKARIFFDPIQTMRGGTQHHAFMIADEVQNLDVGTMHGLATRIGEGSKFVFCGNFSQIDVSSLRSPKSNGLYKLLDGLYEREMFEYFDHINFTETQRHPVVEAVEDIMRNHAMAEEFAKLEARGNV